METQTTQTKRGRGRPKGTTAYVTVTMDQLAGVLQGSARVPISRQFALEQGLDGETAKAADIRKSLESRPEKIEGQEIGDEAKDQTPIVGEEIV